MSEMRLDAHARRGEIVIEAPADANIQQGAHAHLHEWLDHDLVPPNEPCIWCGREDRPQCRGLEDYEDEVEDGLDWDGVINVCRAHIDEAQAQARSDLAAWNGQAPAATPTYERLGGLWGDTPVRVRG